MSKTWSIAAAAHDLQHLADAWGVSPLVAQILCNRGIEDAGKARAFLQPKLSDLYDPSTLPGAAGAAERLARAVRDHQKIVIYGDYDVDGITGTAILWHLLHLAGADVDLYVPHRLEEGYGINTQALTQIREAGAHLVVSVDCGITAVEAAETARAVGLELIITDHHAPHGELPRCAHIVHPTALGESPNPDLCGAGVAFKLAWLLAQKISGAARVSPEFREYLVNATGLAALGTVADVVPLSGENRIITRFGLLGLPRTSIVGLQALIASAGLSGATIDSYAVGFKLAPRLNAAGRMGHARLAMELLTRAGADRAREIAAYLEEQNRARQSLEKKITRQATELVRQRGLDRDDCRAIVLAEEHWHAGVIGIVASRLVDEFHRPTVMIALADGVGSGSARSIRHFELNLALEQCAGHLLSYGGHQMAAGLKIEPGRIDAFREAFVAYANNRLTASDLVPRLRLDAEVGLAEFDARTVQTLADLGPFGMHNPRPKLASRWLELQGDPRAVGKTADHLQFTLREGDVVRKAIGFGLARHEQDLRDHRRCRVAFEPILSTFNGRQRVELQVLDVQVPDP